MDTPIIHGWHKQWPEQTDMDTNTFIAADADTGVV